MLQKTKEQPWAAEGGGGGRGRQVSQGERQTDGQKDRAVSQKTGDQWGRGGEEGGADIRTQECCGPPPSLLKGLSQGSRSSHLLIRAGVWRGCRRQEIGLGQGCPHHLICLPHSHLLRGPSAHLSQPAPLVSPAKLPLSSLSPLDSSKTLTRKAPWRL